MCQDVQGSQNYHLLPCHKQPNGVHAAETTGRFGNRLYFISSPALHGSIIPVLLSSRRFPAEEATLALLQLGTGPRCS